MKDTFEQELEPIKGDISTLEEAVSLLDESVQELHESIEDIELTEGPKGDKGEPGPKGEKGDKGDHGDTGPRGLKGDKGDSGKDGAKGQDGKDGDDGKSVELKDVLQEIIPRLPHGGGNMNRNIAVGGNTSVLGRYTDLNIKPGANVTLTYAPNNTTKYTDLTIAATGGGGGGAGGTMSYTVASADANAIFIARADYVCDGVADDVQINAAIAAASADGGGTVELSEGTFYIAGRITNKSHVTVVGAAIDTSILLGYVAFDWVFYNNTAITDFSLRRMTIDINNGSNAGALYSSNSTRGFFQEVKFKNVAAGGWMVNMGAEAPTTDGVVNFDNKFIDCVFDTHAGSLEMFVLLNAQNTEIVRCKFTNNGTGPILGLYQKCYDTKIVNPVFVDNQGLCIYYSMSCDRIRIINPYFDNCGNAIQGANVSDWGVFGQTYVNDLYIENPILKGGAYTTDKVGIQLGATNNAVISNPNIEGYTIGIHINGGNNGLDTMPINWTISNPQIRNGNPADNFHLIHPGIFIAGPGGNCYGKIINGQIYDDRGTQLQRYPIVFDGAHTWDFIDILYNRLSADTANGGTSIALADSAVLGGNVYVYGNTDFSGTTPAQIFDIEGGVNFNDYVTITGSDISLDLIRTNGAGAASVDFIPNGAVTPSNVQYSNGLYGSTDDYNIWYYDGSIDNRVVTVKNTGKIGIQNTNPGAILDIGTPGSVAGVYRLEGATTGYVQVQAASIAGSWTMTLPSTMGVAGQVLQTDGNGITSWSTAASSVAGGITRVSSVISVSSTIGSTAQTDYALFANVGIKLTLPTAVGNTNLYTIKNYAASSVLLATSAGETIDDSATALLTQKYQSLDLMSNGSIWGVV